MKKLFLLLTVSCCFIVNYTFAQGADCNTADPFCTGVTYTFPASTTTTAPTGPNYGCLGSEPNPAFYYVQIATSGTLTIDISQVDASGSGQDVDFICWGPFTSPSAGCATGLTGSAVDCSYSASATETCTIPTAVAGEFYILMLTNFSGVPADITFASNPSSTATTNCAILCNMTGLTAVPGACNPATNTYTLTGTITYSSPPTTGTLTVTNSCSGVTQVFNPPFPATTQAYSLAGLPANGAGCTVTAVFSADPLCTLTTSFTAPPACSVVCTISGVTATPTACSPPTQQYDVSGNVTFVNPPASGTLTISNSCGGTPVVFNAPFTSPAAYSFTGLTANGASCNVTAVFSADAACTFTQAYTAPNPCPITCSITTLSSTPSACDPATNNYSVTGSVSFVNPPSSGTLTISSSCGGTVQILNAPFASPLAYALNGLTSNGASCTVTAVFSADPTCTLTQNYAAPISCSSCPVTAGNNGPLCAGQTLNLTATNVPGATYSWTGPGGFTSTLQNPTIPSTTSGMSGVYTVTVNVVSPPCAASSSTTVTINPLPAVTVNSPMTCTGIATTLTAGGATNYTWSTGGTTASISVPGTAATYTVIGTGPGGCADTAIATVTTTAPPNVSFISSTTGGCNPVFVTFTADTTGNAGASYTWDFDGSGGSGSTASNLFTTNGCHTITLTVSFGTGCSTTDSVVCMVNVIPRPIASFTWNPQPLDILNPTAYFDNTSVYSSTWMWSFGDGGTSTAQNPIHTFPDIGVYPVTLYAMSATGGCIDSTTVPLEVSDIITAYIPNSFSPNADNHNDVFNISGHGIAAEGFELLIFDRWGNRILDTRDMNEGWNGAVNNKGEVVEEDVYVYRFSYKDVQGKKHKAIGHVTIVK
ncbi:MAG: PKD domain-containing protein [Bacteroidia bacterium]